MNFHLTDILSYTIAIPVLISLAKFRYVKKKFLPFFLFLLLGLLTELVSTVLINMGHSNAAVTNIYTLAEIVLLTTQFNKWQLFRSRTLFVGFQVGFSLFWFIENLLLSSLDEFNSYSVVAFSLALVFFSITLTNRLLVNENKTLLSHPVFLACIAFIVYFTYCALVEIFWIYGLDRSASFRTNVYNIMAFVNLFANILYGLVLIWIPRKQECILL
jgi:hypothetical protein